MAEQSCVSNQALWNKAYACVHTDWMKFMLNLMNPHALTPAQVDTLNDIIEDNGG